MNTILGDIGMKSRDPDGPVNTRDPQSRALLFNYGPFHILVRTNAKVMMRDIALVVRIHASQKIDKKQRLKTINEQLYKQNKQVIQTAARVITMISTDSRQSAAARSQTEGGASW